MSGPAYARPMTAAAWALLVCAAVAAVGDWVAVAARAKRYEYVCKPLTIAFLIGVAATVDLDVPSSTRTWFLVALLLSLLGDVFLMVPPDLFVAGLGAFLVAHVAYVAGLWSEGIAPLPFALGLAVMVLAGIVVGGRVLRAVRAGAHAALAPPVAAYMAVITLMVVSAIGAGRVVGVAGALLFYCSDATIAWERFVRSHRWHRVAIIVTYHLAQAGLVLSLTT